MKQCALHSVSHVINRLLFCEHVVATERRPKLAIELDQKSKDYINS
jgi:hypothetical protein